MKSAEQKTLRKKKPGKQELVVFLIACALVALLLSYRGREFPVLTAYGIKDWATVCEGKGRFYRLRSQNLTDTVSSHRTSISRPSITSRDLQFLDEEGKILYFTNYFYKNSLDKDFVWRFKYTSASPAQRFFDWAEQHKTLYKIMSAVFQADYKKHKDKNQTTALKGDEIMFEIADSLDKLSVTLKGGGRVQLPCKPVSP